MNFNELPYYFSTKFDEEPTKSRVLCFFALRDPCFRAFRAQNWGFCVRMGSFSLVFGLPEHKIEVFVLFWPSEPPFSGILSTKSAFLCQKRRYFPGFGSSQAQNRHFCALLLASFLPMAPPASNKPHLAEKISSLASNLAHLGQMWLPPGRGAAAGWQMVLPDCAARKNLPLRRRDFCSTGDRGTEEDAAALGLQHGRGRAALATMGWCRSEEVAAKGAPSGR